MSLTKETAHDLRLVTTQPGDLAVLPSWAKVIPLAFYAGFGFCLLALAYYTFNIKIYEERSAALNRVVAEYQELLNQDRITTQRLKEQSNTAVRIARWVDYSPMLQKILMGVFSSLNERVQISELKIERKPGIQPEYTIDISFRAAEGDISGVTKKIRESLMSQGWVLTTIAQVYRDSITSYHGDLQPLPSMMPLESQYLPIQEGSGDQPSTAPNGGAQ